MHSEDENEKNALFTLTKWLFVWKRKRKRKEEIIFSTKADGQLKTIRIAQPNKQIKEWKSFGILY
jgi:hypothetical protein